MSQNSNIEACLPQLSLRGRILVIVLAKSEVEVANCVVVPRSMFIILSLRAGRMRNRQKNVETSEDMGTGNTGTTEEHCSREEQS